MDHDRRVKLSFNEPIPAGVIRMSMSVNDVSESQSVFLYESEDFFCFNFVVESGVDDDAFFCFRACDHVAVCLERSHRERLYWHVVSAVSNGSWTS